MKILILDLLTLFEQEELYSQMRWEDNHEW